MVSYCDQVVSKIESAASEIEVKKIIDDSLLKYRSTKSNVHNEVKYILNMIVTLQSEAAVKGLSEGVLNNLKLAVEIFRKYRNQVS